MYSTELLGLQPVGQNRDWALLQRFGNMFHLILCKVNLIFEGVGRSEKKEDAKEVRKKQTKKKPWWLRGQERTGDGRERVEQRKARKTQ